MNFTLKIWRQKSINSKGEIVTYEARDISSSASFLEMLDVVNERLIATGDEPIAFDHDCREGICGMCSLTINGVPHGHDDLITVCQLHMRSFKDGETIYIEPFRAKPFPVLKDLITDRSSFDKIIRAGGYIDMRTGSSADANSIAISKDNADVAFDAAACIGCGACVASCKNSSAMLFVAAKVSQFASLPQGQPERKQRVLNMMNEMDSQGFGNCSNHYECEAVCPKGISADFIATLNREYIKYSVSDSVV